MFLRHLIIGLVYALGIGVTVPWSAQGQCLQTSDSTQKEAQPVIPGIPGFSRATIVRHFPAADPATLQHWLDSLSLATGTATKGGSKMEVFRIAGPDGFETFNWLELRSLEDLSGLEIWHAAGIPPNRIQERSEKPFLGVILDTEMNAEPGIRILEVIRNSSAEKAGLQKDDRILRINGDSVNRLEDLVAALNNWQAGLETDLAFLRNDSVHLVRIMLATYGECYSGMARSLQIDVPSCCNTLAVCALHGGDSGYQVIAHRTRPRLGVYVENLDEEMIRDLRVPEAFGVLVTRVMEKTAASKIGVKINDVIVRLNGQDIRNATMLGEMLSRMEMDDPVHLEIVRYGEHKFLSGHFLEYNDREFLEEIIWINTTGAD